MGHTGAGRIARKFASDLKYVEGARLFAVGARTFESAHTFATEFPGIKAYEGYENLVERSGDRCYLCCQSAWITPGTCYTLSRT